jgi:hypothetical protein
MKRQEERGMEIKKTGELFKDRRPVYDVLFLNMNIKSRE